MAPTKTVYIYDASDADPSHRPKTDAWKPVVPPTGYLEKLATLWLESRHEQVTPGITYRLDRLPEGYILFERPRPSGAKHIDRHLYGSPKHRFFDSPNRFWPHFRNLMERGSNHDCPCTICGTATSNRLPIRAPGPKPAGPLLAHPVQAKQPRRTAIDVENVPDTLRNLLSDFKIQGKLNVEFKEPLSMDWQSERKRLPDALQKLPDQPSFLPRRGEIVLFVRSLDNTHEICREDSSSQFKVYDTQRQTFLGHPKWEAGIAAQEPTEKIYVSDLLEETRKKSSVTYSGFRIEPFAKDKFSSSYSYVPLHHIRPFIFWRELLTGIAAAERHDSIVKAFLHTVSWNFVEKYRLGGIWPLAVVAAKGIFLGPELIVVGDAVRLKDVPGGDRNQISDVLTVSHIALEFEFSDSNDPSNQMPYSCTVRLYGKVFTRDRARAHASRQSALSKSEATGLPKGMHGYRWYYVNPESKNCKVDLHRVVGRCFEAEAMLLWFPPTDTTSIAIPEPLLSMGLRGIRRARSHAREHDKRMPPGTKFFWTNSRGEGLGLRELNGVPLAEHDVDRDEEKLEEWEDALRALVKTGEKMLSMPSASNQGRKISLAPGDSGSGTDIGTPFRAQNSLEPGPASRSVSITQTLNKAVENDHAEDDMRALFGLSQGRKRSKSIAEESNGHAYKHKTDGEGETAKRVRVDITHDE